MPSVSQITTTAELLCYKEHNKQVYLSQVLSMIFLDIWELATSREDESETKSIIILVMQVMEKSRIGYMGSLKYKLHTQNW